ncbi:MAG: hypothetical protein ACO1NQ_09700 [Flavobacteriales bacterium]
MKHPALLLLVACVPAAQAQVDLDRSIRYTGPDGTRRLEGLADPVDETAAIPVAVMASGMVHWAEASATSNALLLACTPPVEALRDGLLLRFRSPLDNDGELTLDVDGLVGAELLKADGDPLPLGALRAASVYEVLYFAGAWHLMNPSTSQCPPGTVRTVDPICMDINAVAGLRFYEAIEHCAERGGKLCTWDEYAVGCALQQGVLVGLFNEWEWIDDTSNHTHSANQAGRTTCQSQRSANVVPVMIGDTRCCYRTR